MWYPTTQLNARTVQEVVTDSTNPNATTHIIYHDKLMPLVTKDQLRNDARDSSITDLSAQVATPLKIWNANGSDQITSSYTKTPSILDSGDKPLLGPSDTALGNRSSLNRHVPVSNSRHLPIKATGTARLTSFPQSIKIHLHATNGFNKILLSVSSLCNRHYVSFTDIRAFITEPFPLPLQPTIVATATRHDGLYYMDKWTNNPVQENTVMTHTKGQISVLLNKNDDTNQIIRHNPTPFPN